MVDRVDCPECAKPMEHQRIEPPGHSAVELDACFACGGLWFDRGELARATQRPPAQTVAGTRSALQCPRCQVALFDEVLGDDDAPAQSCFRCKGVWVPGASVDTAIRLHPNPNPGPPPAEPKQHRIHHWLSNWFGG